MIKEILIEGNEEYEKYRVLFNFSENSFYWDDETCRGGDIGYFQDLTKWQRKGLQKGVVNGWVNENDEKTHKLTEEQINETLKRVLENK